METIHRKLTTALLFLLFPISISHPVTHLCIHLFNHQKLGEHLLYLRHCFRHRGLSGEPDKEDALIEFPLQCRLLVLFGPVPLFSIHFSVTGKYFVVVFFLLQDTQADIPLSTFQSVWKRLLFFNYDYFKIP